MVSVISLPFGKEALRIVTVKALTLDARKMFGLCERFARAEAGTLFYRFSCQIDGGGAEEWLAISEAEAF